MTISYQHDLDGVSERQLGRFFVSWPNPPAPATHLRLLRGSQHVVGFITALSDGVLSAYIPHLEVLPAYQGRGIGTVLLQQMLGQLRELYMVDLICDPPLQPFYERLGMRPWSGMVLRNYDRQSGESPE